MKPATALGAGAVALAALGILMIGLGGARAGIAPPAITGVGFLVIAGVFLTLRKH
jgi:hypothetical protein